MQFHRLERPSRFRFIAFIAPQHSRFYTRFLTQEEPYDDHRPRVGPP